MPGRSSSEWIVRLCHWVEEDQNIRLALLVGSQARKEQPADSFSDIDLVLFTRHPDLLLRESGWVARLGRAWTIHREPNGLGSGEELRVLFEDGQDVDFAVFPFAGRGSLLLYHSVKWLMKHPEAVVLRHSGATTVLSRGFRVLSNKDQIVLPSEVKAEPPKLPTLDEFGNFANDFWFHLVWAAKKLRRGELLTAMGATNGYLRALLVETIRWHALAKVGHGADTWHDARFFEAWADPRAIRDFGRTVARYDLSSVADALRAGRDLFAWLSRELGESLPVLAPVHEPPGLSQYLERLLTY